MTSVSTASPNRSKFLSNAYCRFLHMAARLDSVFLLAVRAYWGWQFAQTGWGKLHNLPHVTEFFASLGIPLPGVNALVVSLMEFVGGILLIAGLGTRLVGLLLAFDMVVAYVASDRAALGSIFSDPAKFYNADPFTFLFAAVIAFVFGAGVWSVDYWIAKRRRA